MLINDEYLVQRSLTTLRPADRAKRCRLINHAQWADAINFSPFYFLLFYFIFIYLFFFSIKDISRRDWTKNETFPKPPCCVLAALATMLHNLLTWMWPFLAAWWFSMSRLWILCIWFFFIHTLFFNVCVFIMIVFFLLLYSWWQVLGKIERSMYRFVF